MTTQYPLQPFPVCTAENYRLGLHFFEWAANETKYIMCSEYPGIGRLKDCAPYHKWSQVRHSFCTFVVVVVVVVVVVIVVVEIVVVVVGIVVFLAR